LGAMTLAQIIDLNEIDAVASADRLRVWDTSNGSERSCSVGDLAAAIAAPALTTQYSTPTATGFSITAAVGWLIISPLATYASGTIVLPSASHGDEVSVSCTQIVTALTITGSTVGAPTALTAGGHFTLRYDGSGQVWYRVA